MDISPMEFAFRQWQAQKMASPSLKQDWTTIAENHPLVQLWWYQMINSDPQLRDVNMIDYMKQGIKNKDYDYQKAIENGIVPSFQPEHGQYRWGDLGKGKNNKNLSNLF
jgi:hypothetical protein